MAFPVHRPAFFLITILVAPAAVAEADTRSAKVARSEAAWAEVRSPVVLDITSLPVPDAGTVPDLGAAD